MRGKRGFVWGAFVFLLAIGLVAFAARRGGESEHEPRAPRLSPRGSHAEARQEPPLQQDDSAIGTTEGEEPAVEMPEGPDEVAHAEPSESSADPKEEAAPSDEEAAPSDESALPASCDHPFVPSTPGSWRRYAWRQSGENQAAELRIEATSARELESGEREITWNIEVNAGNAQLVTERLTTRCIPGQSAEEPWFGILERSLGLRPVGRDRWRWPAELRAGERFEGTARFDTEGAQMRAPDGAEQPSELRVTRRHSVGEPERVEVPAGSFRAWRVEYEERHAYGERGESGTGVVWVAPDLGMVKSMAENSKGVSQSIELVAFGAR